MKCIVFDIETNGLELNDVTRLHCLSISTGLELCGLFQKPRTLTDHKDVINLIRDADYLVGHNIVSYDIPVLEKLLGTKIKAKLIDTLALSWYLYPDRNFHSLESFDPVRKVQITDWDNLSLEEYTKRCENDVAITVDLWKQQYEKLLDLYGNEADAMRLVNYLTFKMRCAQLARTNMWRVDVEKCKEHINVLSIQQEEKIKDLQKVMPPVAQMVKKRRPAKPFTKSGLRSAHGEKWFNLLDSLSLPHDYPGEVEVKIGEEIANPNSSDQVKDWLFSLGWEPCTYKFVKDDYGNERGIPQVRNDAKKGGGLTQSVINLIETHPEVAILDGLTVIQHRLGIFKAFVELEKDGFLRAEISGFTNTLRFKHKNPLVNLPGVDKPWGKEIRGALLASDDDHILCGSDMVSLEDTTKRHYMYPYDPDYVDEMSKPGFDPHLDLAQFAGACTTNEIYEYVNKLEGYKDLSKIRKAYKQTNYSCIYGVGKKKLARELGITEREAEALIKAYWERNQAVKKAVDALTIRKYKGEMWLFNPVSKFYYSLRYEKDKFSTLNQGTGVYCFDKWISHWINTLPYLIGQFHDETILNIHKEKEEEVRTILRRAIDKTNEELRLNIKLDIDSKFGGDYSAIH